MAESAGVPPKRHEHPVRSISSQPATRVCLGLAACLLACDDGGPRRVESLDAAADDAALPLDGGADGAVEPYDCELGSMRFEEQVESAGGSPFALGAFVDTGHLLYTVPTCLEESGLPTGHGLRWAEVPSGGELPAANPVASDGEECAPTRDPALAVIGGGRVYAYFARDEGAGDQLFAQDVFGESASHALAPAPGRDSVATAAGVVERTAMVAWVSRTPLDPVTRLSLYRGSSSSSRVDVVDEAAGQRISTLVLAGLGRGQRERSLGVLAWVDGAAGAGAIRLQIIDEQAGLVGSPRVLSEQVGVTSSVAAVAHPDGGGAVVYTVGSSPTRNQIRLLLLDENGEPRGDAVSVTYGDQNARDAAIARYATGYAVLYRHVPADASASASIRIAALDEHGLLGGTREVASAGRNVGQLRAVQANDGRLFVAWVDADDTTAHSTLHMVRAVCQ